MADIIVEFSAQGAEQVRKEAAALSDEFKELADAVTLSKEKLLGMKAGTKEFDTLQREIQATETVLNSMGASTQKSTTRLRDMRNEAIRLRTTMQELEKQGLKNTDQYRRLDKVFQDLTKDAARLQDEISDVSQEVKTASSDTAKLDTAIRGLQLGVNVFGALQAGAALFGSENEQLEKTLVKLNGIMLLSNSLQQIATELTRKDSVATAINAQVKRVYATAVGTATGATKIFRIALASLGITALIIGLVALISNFGKVAQAISNAFPGLAKFGNKVREITLGITDFIGITNKQNRENNALVKSLEQQNKTLERNAQLYDARGELAKSYEANRQIILNNIKVLELQKEQNDETRNSILDLKTELQVLEIEYNKSTESKKENTKALADNNAELEKQVSTYEQLNTLLTQTRKELTDAIADGANESFITYLGQQINAIQKTIDEIDAQMAGVIFKTSDKAIASVNAMINALQASLNVLGLGAKAVTNQIEEVVDEAALRAEEMTRKAIEGLKVVQPINQIAGLINNTILQATQVRIQKEEQLLQQQRDKGLISEKQYIQKLRDLKNKEARRQRAAQLTQAIFDIPLAVLSAFANTPGGPIIKGIAAAIAGATAAAQFAILAATPIPKFFKGVIDLPLGNNRKGKDTIPAMLHEGESVMTAAETKRFKPELMAIRKNEMPNLYEKKALEIISKNRNLMTPNVDLTPLKMELAWINQRLKDGNNDRRSLGGEMIGQFKKSKVRT